MSSPDHIDVGAVLQSLKSFQRRSVDYVFDRLYGDDATRRFLLADEVGLGKTHVARGVIAKSIEHLRASGKSRIAVVYICSNADIARQNISRLNVSGQEDFQLASRITMLPEKVRELEHNSLNFISFTPGTSFDLGHSEGKWQERRLLYWLLKRTWPTLCNGAAAMNVLQSRMSKDNFRASLKNYDTHEQIDHTLAKQFSMQLRDEDKQLRASGELTYKDRFAHLCQRFARNRKHIPLEDRYERREFIGKMRTRLAATCIKALRPDLIILDEFQRFKDLLDPDNEAGALAMHLFARGEARVLLLSATPYKMYTLSHESDVDDHYRDFVNTLRFLIDDEDRTQQVQGLLTEYGRMCARLSPDRLDPLRRVKDRLETELRRVMCRTEKLAVTEDRGGMLRDADGPGLSLRPEHVQGYLNTRRVADALGHRDIVEYWKASPFLLNLMDADHYKLKSLLRDALEEHNELVDDSLSGSSDVLLGRDAWQAYGAIDPKHAQLDRLLEDTIANGWWRRLWVPPAHPDYELEDVFSGTDAAHMTKRLVFSSWHVVPRAISVLLSYEAERHMMTTLDADAENTQSARKRRGPLLNVDRSDNRLTGMPVLGMLYPSVALSELGAAAIAEAGTRTRRPLLDHVLEIATHDVNSRLETLIREVSDEGAEDESWYWAAPILLDHKSAIDETEAWFEDAKKLADAWSGQDAEAAGWFDHVAHAAEVASGRWRPSGRPPRDLAQVLALMSVAGPAVCALRAFMNELGAEVARDPLVRHAAGRASWGIRSLFNVPEVIALIRGMNSTEPYWRRVLEYCAAGCLQSVLDEYLHILVEAEGLVDTEPAEAAEALAAVITSTAGMRAATPGVDWIERDAAGHHQIENHRVRARFAMRFGDERGERDEDSMRKDVVRKAFNSPFWPFVLATTSIGQEGLDFHCYCHAVMHWNLPSNPVDLEQREGRVHRYKGHAVRKNVAHVARADNVPRGPGNPWRALFEHAHSVAGDESEVSPFWVFPVEGGAFIERHVPSLPLSREAARLPALRRSLAVYRMVFGQPRQEDLVEHLQQTVPEEHWAALSQQLAVRLEPRMRQVTGS